MDYGNSPKQEIVGGENGKDPSEKDRMKLHFRVVQLEGENEKLRDELRKVYDRFNFAIDEAYANGYKQGLGDRK